MLELYDSFLSSSDFIKCRTIIQNGTWRFTGQSVDQTPNKFWYMDLMQYIWIREELFNYIQTKLNKRYELLRVYANGHTYGVNGDFHQDSSEDSDYTLLLYMNPWQQTDIDRIGGYTFFKESNNQILQCVEPLENRAVLFKATQFHKGCAPNRECYDLRVTIAFKLRLIL